MRTIPMAPSLVTAVAQKEHQQDRRHCRSSSRRDSAGCRRLLWWHSNSSKASQAVALAECKVAAKQYTNAQKKLTTAISNGQTSAQTSTSDVADANTLTTLNRQLQDAGNPG